MAFAPSTTYFDIGDGTILGRFDEVEHGHTFEFSLALDSSDYPHKVWVSDQRVGGEQGWRWAIVKKTVAYIVVDEDDNGPVIQKWYIKNHCLYRPQYVDRLLKPANISIY